MRLTYNFPRQLSSLSLSGSEIASISSQASGVASEGGPVSECPYVSPYPSWEERAAKERRLLWRVAHRLQAQRMAAKAAQAIRHSAVSPASSPIAAPASPASER